jgi:glycosyltransferase involved in cell wall biosynthesis
MPGAANKPFDYLTAGLGLIVNDSDIWRRFFTDRGTAISCDPDSPEEIAGAILTLVNQPAVLAEMRSVAYGLLDSEWNFERQIAGILTIVDMVTGKGMVPQ